jgi:hypothetical protein
LKDFLYKNKFAIKWIGYAFIIRAILFLVFSILYYQNWSKEFIVNKIFICSGDTGGYYLPVENFVLNGSYNSYCRMPGLLPIYAPLFFLFGSEWGKTFVVLIQFMLSTLSVYLLAITAQNILGSKKAFYFTFFLFAISTFTCNWDHFGLSDSFGVSFLVFATFFLFRNPLSSNKLNYFMSGLFLIGSVFFRPVHLIFYLVFYLIIFFKIKSPKDFIINSALFSLTLVLFLGLWIVTTYNKYNKLIFLQGSVEECFGSYSKEKTAIWNLIIAWGGDIQPWTKGSAGEWFLNSRMKEPDKSAIKDCYYSTAYNYDSLVNLRSNYRRFSLDQISAKDRSELSHKIIHSAERFRLNYKAEHPFNFYFGSRIKIFSYFLFPSRLNDFPTPPFSQMNFFHKLLKGFYYILLIFVLSTGLFGLFIMIYLKNPFVLIPISLLSVLILYFACPEQRYLVPLYPYFIISSFVCIGNLKSFFIRAEK